MKVRALVFATLLLLSVVHASAAEDLVGRASVIDGDTIEIHGKRVRISGIDAPERRQECADGSGKSYRCGQVAAAALDLFLLEARPATCQILGRDRYKRFVGRCRRADGIDVGSWMVRGGHALDWPRYSKGIYRLDEIAAESSGSGVWAGKFIKPWEWRKK
jgi:endonuclease YncB( thermonuclease family)